MVHLLWKQDKVACLFQTLNLSHILLLETVKIETTASPVGGLSFRDLYTFWLQTDKELWPPSVLHTGKILSQCDPSLLVFQILASDQPWVLIHNKVFKSSLKYLLPKIGVGRFEEFFHLSCKVSAHLWGAHAAKSAECQPLHILRAVIKVTVKGKKKK